MTGFAIFAAAVIGAMLFALAIFELDAWRWRRRVDRRRNRRGGYLL